MNADDLSIKSLRSDLHVRARFRRSTGCMYVAIYRRVHQQTVKKGMGNRYTMNNTSRFNWHSSAGFPRRWSAARPLRRFLAGGTAPSPGRSSTVPSCDISLPSWTCPDSILFEVDCVCDIKGIQLGSRLGRVASPLGTPVAVRFVPTH